MIGLETYDFPNKNEWRKKVWLEIKRRIPFPSERKEAIAIILGGEEDFDRRLATEQGFKSDNLILVEKEHERVNALRQKNKNVIEGDLRDILREWPRERKVGVLLADLCSGISLAFADILLGLITDVSFSNTVFLFNFQRGREKQIGEWKAFIDLFKGNLKKYPNIKIPTSEDIHRGFLFYHLLQGPFFENDSAREIFGAPKFWSYKSCSGNIWMDSVLFANFWGKLNSYNDEAKSLLAKGHLLTGRASKLLSQGKLEKDIKKIKDSGKPILEAKGISERFDDRIRLYELGLSLWGEALSRMELMPDPKMNLVAKGTKNKIRAALAIRTMRLNGTLSHSPSA